MESSNENRRVSVLVEETDQERAGDLLQKDSGSKMEKLKKPIIFLLMGVVFIGCMLLIFKPSSKKEKKENAGLNEAVPQATDAGMQPDKQKAYEQALMDQKEQEKSSALTSLSDYWNDSTKSNEKKVLPEGEKAGTGMYPGYGEHGGSTNAALNSYRNAQTALGTFYQDNSSELQELRKQVEGLKNQLAEKDATPREGTIDNQLALMEKSYQMAAKYLPSNNGTSTTTTNQPDVDSARIKANPMPKGTFVAFTPLRKNAVSSLYREPSNAELLENVNGERNRGFYTTGTNEQVSKPKNSVRACIQETQTVSGEGLVRIRLLETAQTPNLTIPVGAVVTANAKAGNGRLQLKVNSIEQDGNIFPVDITVYDLDGQPGLNVPYSPEMNALTEIASNMSQTSGMNLMMTQSAGQQIAGDLSRGLVQGVSGYFSKKIRVQKVTLKAGYQLFLVSKN